MKKILKKPIIYFRNRFDVFRFAFALILCVAASLPFFLYDEAVAVFANGDSVGVKGLFNLINGWV